MRNYRIISKQNNNIAWGGGQSQAPQPPPPIAGSGVLTIGGESIPFVTDFNTNLRMANMFFLDRMRFTQGGFVGAPLNEETASYFALSSSPANFTAIHNILGMIVLHSSHFLVIKATPTETVLRGTGTTSVAGTIQSAGFDLLSNLPLNARLSPSIISPVINVFGIPSTLRGTSWTFVPALNILFNIRTILVQGRVYTMPFNIDTFSFGPEKILAGPFHESPLPTYITDGVRKLFRILGTLIQEIDLETGFIINHFATGTFPTSFVICYDYHLKRIVYYNTASTGTTSLAYNLETRLSSVISTVTAEHVSSIHKDYMFCRRDSTNFIALPYGNNIAVSQTPPSVTVPVHQPMPDSNGWSMRGTFETPTDLISPRTFAMTYFRLPIDTSTMIAPIPPRFIPANTPFTVDFTIRKT